MQTASSRKNSTGSNSMESMVETGGSTMMSYVYVLHFHQKHHHAKHYVGCTAALKKRLETHANDHGARLLEVVNQEGLTWELGGLYSCSHAEMRRQEKALKATHDSQRYCQVCHPKDQAKRPGMQTENIHTVSFSRQSSDYVHHHVRIAGVGELDVAQADVGMEFILSLMRKDKDALGFVPVGGKKGISHLLNKQQIIIATEDGTPCGYAFYTTDIAQTSVQIHQACVADEARLRGHGKSLVEYIAAKHPELAIVAKVRDDLAANHFWTALGFAVELTKQHETSGSTIHHYHRKGKQ